MLRSTLRRCSLLALTCALAGGASAEEGLGLDLTDATDYRPSLALTLPASGGEGVDLERLAQVLLDAAVGTEKFSSVLGPEEARVRLGNRLADTTSFDEMAVALQANVVVLAELSAPGTRPSLNLFAFTRYTGELERAEVPWVKGAAFERDVGRALRKLLEKPAGMALGLLEVRTRSNGAVGRLGPHPLGAMPGVLRVPPGEYRLELESHSRRFERELVVVANQKQTVSARLEPKLPPVRLASAEVPLMIEQGTPSDPGALWRKPGLYVAAGGAALVVIGAVLGSSAKGIESRMVDANRDGALDVTLREVRGAQATAMAGNVLMGVGAAAVAGGTVWLLVTPRSARPGVESGVAGLDAVAVGISGALP